MNLVDFYRELSLNPKFFEKYYSTSSKSYGKIFSFISTNYRGILIKARNKLQGFAQGFRVLENVEGVKRSEWLHATTASQEVEKQHVVNMRKSEFFRVVNDAYVKTSRGIVFKKLITDAHLKHEEQNLICLILLLAGYFSDTPNYIVERTKKFFQCCNRAGYSDEEVLSAQENFISKAKTTTHIYDLFGQDYIYMDSFFMDYDTIDFLKMYKDAPPSEKLELHNYIFSMYRTKRYTSKQEGCVISYKFKPGGNYVKNTIVDNAWILYVVKHIIDSNCSDFDIFITEAILSYKKLFAINEARVRSFIYNTDKNRSVFQVIFCKVTNTPISPLSVAKDLKPEELAELSLSDATDAEGAIALDTVNVSLKKLAKLNANYQCALEKCEMCKYFTAKESNHNYLEIHHLIPREFANDFDSPIEILDNYVALCPNCHRKIHLAVDKERLHMINTLYMDRKDKLSEHGLNIELKELYRYYKIDD